MGNLSRDGGRGTGDGGWGMGDGGWGEEGRLQVFTQKSEEASLYVIFDYYS